MPAVELVVTDLDGTFWHTDDHLPDAVLAAVAELERRGVPLLVATGRRLASTRDPLAAVGLAPPAIMLNGAIGIDLAHQRALPRGPLPDRRRRWPPTTASSASGSARWSTSTTPATTCSSATHPDTNPAHVDALGDTAGDTRPTSARWSTTSARPWPRPRCSASA